MPAPAEAFAGRDGSDFGAYVHVPFCATRCGYCDFNTYTSDELGDGATRSGYADSLRAEAALAAAAAETAGARPPTLDTVFFGGGTPTELRAGELVRMLEGLDETFGIAAGAEITSEANPDSLTPEGLDEMRAGGFNRLSVGMQSAVPHVLATLDRTHRPEGVPQAVTRARAAGFEHISLDLIYGTPGESLADWRASLEAALELEPDHISAYALIVEDGTALARNIARGRVPEPDDDLTAEKYELADHMLMQAGLCWYELSNWARGPEERCRHNELYWRSDDWIGLGPGAHSHIARSRWWNTKHPRPWAQQITGGYLPVAGGEKLDDATVNTERILLESRMVDGLALTILEPDARGRVDELIDDGLAVLRGEHLVLTLRGRLLADVVARTLTTV